MAGTDQKGQRGSVAGGNAHEVGGGGGINVLLAKALAEQADGLIPASEARFQLGGKVDRAPGFRKSVGQLLECGFDQGPDLIDARGEFFGERSRAGWKQASDGEKNLADQLLEGQEVVFQALPLVVRAGGPGHRGEVGASLRGGEGDGGALPEGQGGEAGGQTGGDGAKVRRDGALQLALRQDRPKQSLENGGDEEAVDQPEECSADFLEGDGFLCVEADDGDKHEEGYLHRHGDAVAVIRPVAEEKEPCGDEQVEDRVAGQQGCASNERDGGPGHDDRENNDVVERTTVSGPLGTQGVERGEVEGAQNHESPARGGEPIFEHQGGDRSQPGPDAVAQPEQVRPRWGQSELLRTGSVALLGTPERVKVEDNLPQLLQGEKLARDVDNFGGSEALRLVIITQVDHGRPDPSCHFVQGNPGLRPEATTPAKFFPSGGQQIGSTDHICGQTRAVRLRGRTQDFHGPQETRGPGKEVDRPGVPPDLPPETGTLSRPETEQRAHLRSQPWEIAEGGG